MHLALNSEMRISCMGAVGPGPEPWSIRWRKRREREWSKRGVGPAAPVKDRGDRASWSTCCFSAVLPAWLAATITWRDGRGSARRVGRTRQPVATKPAPVGRIGHARGGDRTRTGVAPHRILSPVRLPVPPPGLHPLPTAAQPTGYRQAPGSVEGRGGSQGPVGRSRQPGGSKPPLTAHPLPRRAPGGKDQRRLLPPTLPVSP